MYHSITNAKLTEIGTIRKSKNWSNIYLKFELGLDKYFWFEIAEHNLLLENYRQINDFSENGICKVGMIMTLDYEIKQSQNKSTKLIIKSYQITSDENL